MQLIKVGGSCLANGADQIARWIAGSVDKPCVIVHGYSQILRSILQTHGIERPSFTTASGKKSRFTTLGALAASHLAAFLTQEQLVGGLRTCLPCVNIVPGHQGCLVGRRRSKIRYKENGVLKVFHEDFSGRIEQIHWSWVDQRVNSNGVVVLTPLLADIEGGMLVCDADHATAQIAVHLGLAQYTILSDIEGYEVGGKVMAQVPQSRIPDYRKHARGGMVKKIHYIAQALKGGVQRVRLLNGISLDTEPSKGTLFYADSHFAH